MDYSWIFSQDFFLEELNKGIPADLLQIRQVNVACNKYFSLNRIKNKIINWAQDQVNAVFGEQYEEFIKIMAKWKLLLYGKWIVQYIHGRVWQPTLKFIFEDSNADIDVDLKKMGIIRERYTYWREKGEYYQLGEKKIRIVGCYNIKYKFNNCPPIFKCSLGVDADNLKWVLDIDNLKYIQKPEVQVNLINDRWEFCINKLMNRYAKYELKINIGVVGHNVGGICFIPYSRDRVLFQGKGVKLLGSGDRLYTNITDIERTSMYVDTKIKHCIKKAYHAGNCMWDIIGCKHFHSYVMCKCNDVFVGCPAVFVEYDESVDWMGQFREGMEEVLDP